MINEIILEKNNGNWIIFGKGHYWFAIKDGWMLGKHNMSKSYAQRMLKYYKEKHKDCTTYETTYNE